MTTSWLSLTEEEGDVVVGWEGGGKDGDGSGAFSCRITGVERSPIGEAMSLPMRCSSLDGGEEEESFNTS